MITFIFSFLMPFCIGASIGRIEGWGLPKKLLVGCLLASLSGFLGAILNFNTANADVQDTLKNTTVFVQGEECTGSGSVVVAPSGKSYLLTAGHVCTCAKKYNKVTVVHEDGYAKILPVVKIDKERDLCAAPYPSSRYSLLIAPAIEGKTEVNTRSYPRGHLTYSHGQYRGLASWQMDKTNWFGVGETNVYARPGSSGGPVVDDQGKLVGVILIWDSENVEYDVGLSPLSAIHDFMSGL